MRRLTHKSLNSTILNSNSQYISSQHTRAAHHQGVSITAAEEEAGASRLALLHCAAASFARRDANAAQIAASAQRSAAKQLQHHGEEMVKMVETMKTVQMALQPAKPMSGEVKGLDHWNLNHVNVICG